jgi:hypothetical protein
MMLTLKGCLNNWACCFCFMVCVSRHKVQCSASDVLVGGLENWSGSNGVRQRQHASGSQDQ